MAAVARNAVSIDPFAAMASSGGRANDPFAVAPTNRGAAPMGDPFGSVNRGNDPFGGANRSNDPFGGANRSNDPFGPTGAANNWPVMQSSNVRNFGRFQHGFIHSG